MSAFRVCFANKPKKMVDFCRGSHQLVCLVFIHNKELAMDNLERVKRNAICALSATLQKRGGVSQNFPLNVMNNANEHVVPAQAEQKQNPTQENVIDSFKAAQEAHYSAKIISLLTVMRSGQTM